ncbi:helix-turn-helix domain-containing protein [Hymenobacter tibetensis]|uniref:helix-turn-helix domain-containing protein n=1 Tax=Hymenobacter tibetensis TaxID=497967 RepID=UPI00293ED5C4|nr:helix-turn-helix domain-containing protein [Hymenobacter tibetensis]
MNGHFNSPELPERGVPAVHYVADCLQLSPKYLSNLMRVVTGQNTQQHIHAHLIAKAKEKLSATSSTASEIAYEFGFEHVPSFSKLFKAKTSLSTREFRATFP